MRYDPIQRNRRSLRLQGYDYSQPGSYFVTICTQQRECLFGEIEGEGMRLNDAGQMVERWWVEQTTKFSTVEVDAYVVMPNHFHGIIVINEGSASAQNVGTPLCGCPVCAVGSERPRRAAPTLWDVVGWFKTMTTNKYIRCVRERGWAPFRGRLWQRGYYEHIVRDDNALNRVRQYIVANPAGWASDPENPAAKRGPIAAESA